MKSLNCILFGVLAFASAVRGQATTDPVGFNTITCLGNSDTRFSVPFHRSTSYQGLVQSVANTTVTYQGVPNTPAAIITVQGIPGWTDSQFVYAAGTQPNTYYAEFGTGSKEGMSYTVFGNTASAQADTSTVTVILNGDTLQGVVATGNVLRIIPYWTLATLFPGQSGITGTTSISGAGSLTRVLVPDIATAGIDLASGASYYYYTGTGFGGAGWRKQGGGFTNFKNDDVLPPDLYVVIRQDGVGTDSIQTGTGTVPITKTGSTVRKYVVGTLQANIPQDNAVALDIPVNITLAASNLYTGPSGAFVGTSSISGSSGDKLLVFDDTVAALNKANTKSYYYYTGTGSGGPGWRLQGGGFTNIKDSDTPFQPGSGVIIRKQAVATPGSAVWTVSLTY